MTRAALYLRISQDQTGQQLGVTRQKEDCQALADSAGWTVVETYVDNDISAYKDRPAYTRMLEDMRNGHLDAVIAWAPDRIYRRIKDLETLIEIIENHNIEIRTVKAGDLDLTGAYGRMLARILGAIAAGEGEIKSERWKRSWRQRREAGEFAANGRRTFGYTLNGQIIEEEREVARWMANKILVGAPIMGLCRELHALGVTTTRGNAWTPQGIKRFLTNPRIAGWSTMDRVPIAEGAWEPLIDRETFEGVKAILTAVTRPYVPRVALLNGLIYCQCGVRMITGNFSNAKTKQGTRTYRCNNRPGQGGCGSCSGMAAPIEEAVESYTKAKLADESVRRAIGIARNEGDDGPYAELAAIELRITELEKSMDDPSLSLNAILRALDRARERQAQLQSTVVARSTVNIPAGDADWPQDLASRRALVDLVVARVVLHKPTRASRLGFDVERVEIVPREF